jgi:hypothetical protein
VFGPIPRGTRRSDGRVSPAGELGSIGRRNAGYPGFAGAIAMVGLLLALIHWATVPIDDAGGEAGLNDGPRAFQ